MHGVSTLTPSLYGILDSIISAIEAQVKLLADEKMTTYQIVPESFRTEE
jgi:hypothetical protein